MDALQGAVLRVKLRYLDGWNAARRAHAAQYDNLLAGSVVQTPLLVPDRAHVYHIYAVRTTQRTSLQAALLGQDIRTGIHYPYAIHQLPAYADLGYREGDFPRAEQAAREVLSLPMYAELTTDQVSRVAQAIWQFGQA